MANNTLKTWQSWWILSFSVTTKILMLDYKFFFSKYSGPFTDLNNWLMSNSVPLINTSCIIDLGILQTKCNASFCLSWFSHVVLKLFQRFGVHCSSHPHCKAPWSNISSPNPTVQLIKPHLPYALFTLKHGECNVWQTLSELQCMTKLNPET